MDGICYAIIKGDAKAAEHAIKVLLDKGEKINPYYLNIAALYGNLEVFKVIYNALGDSYIDNVMPRGIGVSFNLGGPIILSDFTPLHIAICYNKTSIIEFLLRHNASTEIRAKLSIPTTASSMQVEVDAMDLVHKYKYTICKVQTTNLVINLTSGNYEKNNHSNNQSYEDIDVLHATIDTQKNEEV